MTTPHAVSSYGTSADASAAPKLRRGLPPEGKYSGPAIFFHWAIAILIPVMVGLGWYMLSIEKQPGSPWYFNLHKSLGLTVALLVVLRLGWRMMRAPAPLPETLARWQTTAAKFTHAALYLLLVLMPLTGYLGAAFSGEGVAYFGVSTPDWATKNEAFKEQLFSAHSIIAWALVAFVAVHVLAALKHLLIDRDGVFQRMLP